MSTGLLGADHPSPDTAAVLALSQSTHLAGNAGSGDTGLAPAEAPMPGRKLLSTGAAQNRLSEQRASRAAERAAELARPKWVRPGTGYLSSCFCARWGTFHYGIDLAAPFGSPIYAAGDGVVIKAGPASGFGQWVVIQHADGDVTIYGHMEKFLVHIGERVQAGQLIALVGSEGESTGPHLHFEVHIGGLDGRRVDPIPWLAARGVTI
ncbi:MAG TPA: M23 family metallopeptidase [Mycobacteriales bacterium]|nr:M23 family metallopeptidase [Mycobacteriales bacterium]